MTTLLSSLEVPATLAPRLDDIRRRVAALEPDAREDFERSMDLLESERFAYQNAQARAHASGRISTDVARYLYRAIGESGSSANGGWPARTSLADKVLVTLAMGELLR